MKELILSAVLPLAVQPSEGETPLDSWLCDVLRAQTPETRLHDFPDEGASKAHLARRRDGEIEEWAIESTHYRVRLRYRQPGGSALRTGFELSIASVADEGPFLFDSPQEAERWLGRLGERVEERPAGALRYSDIREGTIHPHFRVVIDVKERSFEIFWE